MPPWKLPGWSREMECGHLLHKDGSLVDVDRRYIGSLLRTQVGGHPTPTNISMPMSVSFSVWSALH